MASPSQKVSLDTELVSEVVTVAVILSTVKFGFSRWVTSLKTNMSGAKRHKAVKEIK